MLAALAALGCSGSDGRDSGSGSERDGAPAARKPPVAVEPARCPRDAANCATATGRVLYFEAHDPDGDGDVHLVLASADGVTAPGLAVIDVERELRPHPLPAPGTEVSAAGPVYPGSQEQRQIQATELHVAGASGP